MATEHPHTRRRVVPSVTFPAELPVSACVAELEAAIEAHQVVVVAGETGSGKSTQLPKICLKLGRGTDRIIGHTQPRRIAARTLAERIASETSTRVGDLIGYTIRFGDHTGPSTAVRLMTDGILLAEIPADPMLTRYDTIIIDEAHERSLNIDFLLGYLARILPQRPDLKVIITSATIDPDRFARHFGDAPVIEVSGRTYPVEIRYRPYDSGDDDDTEYDDRAGSDSGARAARRASRGPVIDQVTAITRAVDELDAAAGGDILVFLSGEREITDTADSLRAHLTRAGGLAAATEVLPLYGRLSMADQHRVFAPSGRRRIVLATNVAETSLTVPGIRYVIDPGTARISRYSTRTKVQRLPIEKISQASANQRAGRCGRVADGICIRLYSEEDFVARPEFTDPEIARTSLAAVLLRMAALGLGDVETFPFLDPPDSRQISDGITVLTELGAIDPVGAWGGARGRRRRRADGAGLRLTDIGREIATLPVDPRLARIIVEGRRRGCLDDILVIVAALAIRDVREYPLEDREKARAAHARFAEPTSDFLAILRLWRYLTEQAAARSGNSLRRMCRAEYLHYLRFREWQDLYAQLASAVRRSPGRRRGRRERRGWPDTARRGSPDAPPDPRAPDTAAIHTALASGLLSQIGARIERDRDVNTSRRGRSARKPPGPRQYQGTRGTTFAIWPGSTLAKTGADLVLAAELVETSRLWARTVAAVEPGWIEQVGGDLLRRSYSEPRWSAKRQAVVATERVQLLGVPLVSGRTVNYDRIDAAVAREIFIRRGLVDGEWRTHVGFLRHNQDALEEVVESERRARRTGIAVDDEALFALYDERIPPGVTSGRHLESWWRKESRSNPDALTFSPDMLVAAGERLAGGDEFPDRLTADGIDLPLEYVFEPGAADDGVSATVPLAALASIDPTSLPAQVPGHRRELAVALIRSLPKHLRRSFVPAPDFADAALARMDRPQPPADRAPSPADRTGSPADRTASLADQLAHALTAMGGTPVVGSDFDLDKVPDHLRMTFTVVDGDGSTVASGKDLGAIQSSLRADVRHAVAATAPGIERSGLTTFPDGGVPPTVRRTVGGQLVIGYPALVDEGDSVGVRLFTTETDQRRALRRGTRRLVALFGGDEIARVAARLRRPTVRRGPTPPGGPAGDTSELTRDEVMILSTSPHGSAAALLADATDAAIDALLDWAGFPVWDPDSFARLRGRIAGQVERAVTDVLRATVTVLRQAADTDAAITRAHTPATAGTIAQLRAERDDWLAPGFVTAVGAAHLPDLTRYLAALCTRAERLVAHPDKDRERATEIAALQAEVDARIATLRPERAGDPDVAAVRRLLAEYRIAQFAQPMKTAVPVSAKRIRAALAALSD